MEDIGENAGSSRIASRDTRYEVAVKLERESSCCVDVCVLVHGRGGHDQIGPGRVVAWDTGASTGTSTVLTLG